MTTPIPTIITRKKVPEDLRITHVGDIFGVNFPMRLEPFVFNAASTMVDDYNGGYWEFYELSNGGFYMAPNTDMRFHFSSPNGYVCELSSDAMGITVCLYAYSMLSFDGIRDFSEVCAEHYHLLREYMMEHPEVASILGAID
jgi:hypothetical protein